MWEQKDDGGGINDKDTTYTRDFGMAAFITLINGSSANGTTQSGLGGYTDWRLPSSAELQTILALPCAASPCIDPIFGPVPYSAFYWTSTNVTSDATKAWIVDFVAGAPAASLKVNGWYMRAVRTVR